MQRYDPDSPGGGRWPPPDIEGMLRDLGERFRGLDGRRIAAGAGVVLLVILLWSSWFTVQPEETGVVQRFGAVVRTVGPGLHFKVPYGVEKVRLVPTARAPVGAAVELRLLRARKELAVKVTLGELREQR